MEQRRDDRRPDRRTQALVEVIFQRQRTLTRGGIVRIQRRLGTALIERGDDVRGIANCLAVEPEDGQRAAARSRATRGSGNPARARADGAGCACSPAPSALSR
jgi:hypothetical protein